MPIHFDRKLFFDGARNTIFAPDLCQAQVDGCEAILAEAERRSIADPRLVAYILATAHWESGRTMQPVREIGLGRGRSYGSPDPATGQTYYGRGLVQLTWKRNYARLGPLCGANLVDDPDLALRLDIAVTILFEGMMRGLFTGKALSDYFSATVSDRIGARRIINGTDRAAVIADAARRFEACLRPAPAPDAETSTPVVPPRVSLLERLKQLVAAAQS